MNAGYDGEWYPPPNQQYVVTLVAAGFVMAQWIVGGGPGSTQSITSFGTPEHGGRVIRVAVQKEPMSPKTSAEEAALTAVLAWYETHRHIEPARPAHEQTSTRRNLMAVAEALREERVTARFEQLLAAMRELPPMTKEEEDAQRLSFTKGQVMLANPWMTEAYFDRELAPRIREYMMDRKP